MVWIFIDSSICKFMQCTVNAIVYSRFMEDLSLTRYKLVVIRDLSKNLECWIFYRGGGSKKVNHQQTQPTYDVGSKIRMRALWWEASSQCTISAPYRFVKLLRCVHDSWKRFDLYNADRIWNYSLSVTRSVLHGILNLTESTGSLSTKIVRKNNTSKPRRIDMSLFSFKGSRWGEY